MDLASIDDQVMFVGHAIDVDDAELKMFELHSSPHRYCALLWCTLRSRESVRNEVGTYLYACPLTIACSRSECPRLDWRRVPSCNRIVYSPWNDGNSSLMRSTFTITDRWTRAKR
jgi:hypothetical protein